jgi:hypothetical protein
LIAVLLKWRTRAGIVALCLLGANLARADPFYLRYDATETFPEQDGWTRYGQDPEGLERRSLEDGWLTLDTRDSYSIMDYYAVRSSALDLEPGEQLRVAWRSQTLETDMDDGFWTDTGVYLTNAAAEYVDLHVATDFVAHGGYASDGKPDHRLWFESGIPHTYVLTSNDMHVFRLDVDGELAFSGDFVYSAAMGPNGVCFGDACIGLRSLSTWDYFEVEVIPEPGALALGCLAAISVGFTTRRVA